MFQLKIQKYILREVVVPMGLGVLVFSFVLLMGNLLKLTDLVINKGVPLKEIAVLFIYIFPSFLDITLAMAFLLGILVGFGRLSADSEIIAMKASGISIGSMLKPVLVLGLAVTLASAWVLFYAKPESRLTFRQKVFDIANSRIASGLQPMVFYHDFDGIVIYAENVEPRSGKLENIFLHDHRDPATASTIFASRGTVFSEAKTLAFAFHLEDGTILRQPFKNPDQAIQVLRFEKYDIYLSFEDSMSGSNETDITPKTMNMTELQHALANTGNISAEEKHLLKVEWHKRIALALVPLLFALVGVPLGIHSPRSGKMAGFAVSLLVFLAYFVLSSFVETLCRDGDVTFYAILWAPDLLFLAAGIFLVYCAGKEKNILFFLPRFKHPAAALKTHQNGKEHS
jgi:lipopolysaccharide export system permease protein